MQNIIRLHILRRGRQSTPTLFLNRQQIPHLKVPNRGQQVRLWNSTSRSRARLEKLEDEANSRAHDATAQLVFLQEVGRVSPEIVIQRCQSGRFASNDAIYQEYLRALAATGRGAEAGEGQMMHGGHQGYGNPTAAAAGNGYYHQQYNQSYNPYHQQQQQYVNPFAATSGGAFNSFQQQTGGAVSSESQPIYVQVVDGGVKSQMWKTLRMLALGVAVLAGVNMFMMDGKGMPRGLGLSNEVKPVMEETGKTFEDVKGANEAKEELQEIVAYLQDPARFTRLGGKLPKGVLLTGPPGTGKTLLAKSIAGEAGTPFFYASGSEFEELYVGVGARRVRDLFDAAKKASPCIVFIDEIDAIGSTRALKEQQALKMTLNQLLVELDGFKESEGVIIVGATNFPEILDPALVRPGRFDRNVVVPLPDLKDRQEILDLYLSKVPIADDVNVEVIARGTPGASGADLANLVNIAALRASTAGAELIGLADLEYAKDKVLMGPERKSAIIPEEVREVTAYHEGGHALVALHTKGAMPIHKATIMPRGGALGMVHQLPEESDMLQRTKRQMMAELDVCMGGRVAEEIIYGEENVSSGAMSDLSKATSLARNLTEKYGMGDSVMFIDKDTPISNETKQKLDEEVKRILSSSYERARKLLLSRKKELHRLAKGLLENESLSSDEIKLVVKGKPLPKPQPLKKKPNPQN